MRLNALALLIISILLFGCGEASRKNLLPRNTGNLGEIVVIAPDAFWNLSEADVFRKQMNKEMYGLPQSERIFHCVEVKKSGFKDLFKTHRNILNVQIDKGLENKVSARREIHSRQQLYITINAKSVQDLTAIIEERLDQILQMFHDEETVRLIDRNKAFGKAEFNNNIANTIDLDIIIQDGFEVAKATESFLWLRLDREKPLGGYQHQLSQGLMVYWRPYTDTNQFSDSSLEAWRNDVTKENVEGPQKSYMAVSERFLLPYVTESSFEDGAAKEIRGLWRMEGYFMGGPFYSYSFYNPNNEMQYMVDGYVYAPQFDKLPLLREVEAIAKSVKSRSARGVE